MDILLVNVDEAARLLGLGRSKTYELVLSGQLQSLKIGRSRKIPQQAIDEFVRSRLEEAQQRTGITEVATHD